MTHCLVLSHLMVKKNLLLDIGHITLLWERVFDSPLHISYPFIVLQAPRSYPSITWMLVRKKMPRFALSLPSPSLSLLALYSSTRDGRTIVVVHEQTSLLKVASTIDACNTVERFISAAPLFDSYVVLSCLCTSDFDEVSHLILLGIKDGFWWEFFDRRPLHIRSYTFHGILPDLIIIVVLSVRASSIINEPRFVSAKTRTELDECGPLSWTL